MDPRLFQAMFVDGNIIEFRDNAHAQHVTGNAALKEPVAEPTPIRVLPKPQLNIMGESITASKMVGRRLSQRTANK
jgi:hypothetical protein